MVANHKSNPPRARQAAPGFVLLLIAAAAAAAVLLTACSTAGRSTAPAVNIPASGPTWATSTASALQTAAAAANSVTHAPSGSAATAAPAQTTATAAGSAATPQNGATAVPTSTPKQVVINAINKIRQAGPYRTQSTTTTDGKTTQTTVEVVLPDRYHIVMPNQEMLIVGNKSYQKQNGKWVAFPIDIGSIIAGAVGPLTQTAEQDISNVQLVGQDTVNGAPATVYQYQEIINSGGSSINSTSKIWIDNASGLPVKQEITGSFGGIESTTVQTIQYDPTIQIEAPAP